MRPVWTLRKWYVLFSLLVALGIMAATATPPVTSYRLGLRRNFGYGGGSQIRGDFTLSLVPESGVSQVTFLMDGQPMATVKTPPFRFRFNTGDYPLGWHELSAEVVTTDGQVFYTPARRIEFVSAEVERQAMVRILVPLLGGVLGLMALGMGLQFLLLGRKSSQPLPLGAPRKYGLVGGAICPRCKRATPLHLWSITLGVGRLDRCEACGRWSVMRRATPAELAAAEQAERQQAAPSAPGVVSPQSEEERLRELLDRSRFLD
ncbi:hypothetical protein [Thermanaerothrix sp.]|uniref:hypothetical protein n=1 Tax=Thermanaerothrix sp. TaxID=2972675 RepID=UPI003C7C82B4